MNEDLLLEPIPILTFTVDAASSTALVRYGRQLAAATSFNELKHAAYVDEVDAEGQDEDEEGKNQLRRCVLATDMRPLSTDDRARSLQSFLIESDERKKYSRIIRLPLACQRPLDTSASSPFNVRRPTTVL